MTADEARRKYKREWIANHREQVKKAQNDFYARKAAEYEREGIIEPGDPLPPSKVLQALEKEIALFDRMIAAPETSKPYFEERRRALLAELEKKKKIYAVR